MAFNGTQYLAACIEEKLKNKGPFISMYPGTLSGYVSKIFATDNLQIAYRGVQHFEVRVPRKDYQAEYIIFSPENKTGIKIDNVEIGNRHTYESTNVYAYSLLLTGNLEEKANGPKPYSTQKISPRFRICQRHSIT